MIRKNFLGIAIIVLLLQGACLTFLDKSLAYNPQIDHLVLHVEERTFPGGVPQLPFCNELPALTIWGDGRVIRRDQTGSIEAEDIRKILSLLDENQFFETQTVDTNPAGIGLELTVYLRSGAYRRSWNFVNSQDPYPAVYQQILDLLAPNLKPFTPKSALLVAVPFDETEFAELLPAEIPTWPEAQLGFSLSEVPEDGHVVSGEAAQFVWQAIQDSPLVTRFRDGEQVYAVSLEIPVMMTPRKNERCW